MSLPSSFSSVSSLKGHAPSFLVPVVLVALIGTTVVLAQRVKESRNRVAALMDREVVRAQAELLPVGRVLPSFIGYAIDGTKIPVSFDKSSPTLTVVFVYSPECSICARTWPQWDRIRQAARASEARQIFIDPTASSSAEYVHRWDLELNEIIAYIAPASDRRLLPNDAVPQLIVTDRQGKVKGSWPGVLRESDVAQIVSDLRPQQSSQPQHPKGND